MKKRFPYPKLIHSFLALATALALLPDAQAQHGDGSVRLSGTLQTWHKVTLTLAGPHAKETDTRPNPFTDYRMVVTFTHESGIPSYRVPGYFAADGNAAESSAEAGNHWRAHLSPDKAGSWHYQIAFTQGKNAAVSTEETGAPIYPYHGKEGSFAIRESDKTGRDFRAHGRLEYVGERYLRFAGTGAYFLKAGPDAPETLLAYQDFDNTQGLKKNVPLKTWKPHVRDWKTGDPTWKDGKGKGLIGALNYLAAKGCNSFSFLPYNKDGDGENVWPFIQPSAKLHYDCSKLDQWGIVFDHGQSLGLYLHFKLQENEMDDHRIGHERKPKEVPAALDAGKLGIERKLYCREIIARFGHALALNWNLGEENTQTPEEQQDMAEYLRDVDPYNHNIVVHTFPQDQDKVYSKILGQNYSFTGASLQNGWNQTHRRTVQWIEAAAAAGKQWVVANDEQGPASQGVPPDPGFEGHKRKGAKGGIKHDLHDIRKYTLWGNLIGGGAGVEYYFGYQLAQNDLICEDFRSRDRSWDYCKIALDFFADNEIAFQNMDPADALVGNAQHDNSKYCLAEAGKTYLVYLPEGGTADLDLGDARGSFRVQWFNPRKGGKLRAGDVRRVRGGEVVALGNPPANADQDWLVVIRQR